MGRYWSMNDETFDGKFLFGLQPSGDAMDVYGLTEQENHIELQTSDDDIPEIKKRLKKLLHRAGLKYDESIVNSRSSTEVVEKCHQLWDEYEKREGIPNGIEINDPKRESYEQKELLMARIVMGYKILYCLKTDGYCEMYCEC